MPTICGAAKASYSRAALWRFKIGETQEIQKPSEYLKELWQHGKDTEPKAIEWIRDKWMNKHSSKAEKTGIWLLEDDPLELEIGATPDLVLTERTVSGLFEMVPIEIKCPYKNCYTWDEAREEKDTYQLMTQMACMNATHGYLVYWVSPTENSVIRVPWQQQLWESMYGAAWTFSMYRDNRIRPPPLSKKQQQKEWATFLSLHGNPLASSRASAAEWKHVGLLCNSGGLRVGRADAPALQFQCASSSSADEPYEDDDC